jgi:protein-disulfide isomerase
MRALLLAAAAAFTLAPAAVAAPAAPAQASDWSQRVEKTAEGGYRVGNPDAPVKLVEFLSLTCGHCAAFAAEAMPALHEQVRAGRVNVEYRNYVLNHYDLAAAVLSRCAAPRNYFNLTNALLEQQEVWAGRVDALTDAQRAEIEVRPTAATLRRTVELLGLDEIAKAHGVTPARARLCLSDAAALDQLLAMGQAAEQLGVEGTPTFMLNGKVIGPHDWASLQPLLGQP